MTYAINTYHNTAKNMLCQGLTRASRIATPISNIYSNRLVTNSYRLPLGFITSHIDYRLSLGLGLGTGTGWGKASTTHTNVCNK